MTSDVRTPVGVKWSPAVVHAIAGQRLVFRQDKVGDKSVETLVGVLAEDQKTVRDATVTQSPPREEISVKTLAVREVLIEGRAAGFGRRKDRPEDVVGMLSPDKKTLRVTDLRVVPGTREVAEYRPAGLFPEVVAWMYQNVADVWKLDNEFAARWGSYAFKQERSDLKVILAAFLLAQDRKGDPVLDKGKLAFYDEDFRAVGEAMLLTLTNDGRDFSPKLALRVRDVLGLPQVVAINRALGFGRSARQPFYGRFDKAARAYLAYREANLRMLEGLARAGYRTTVMELASACRFQPETERFFEIIRWKQKQAPAGYRTLAIGKEVRAAETWEGLSERAICERITSEKPGYKRIVGLLPRGMQVTAAMLGAAIEAGALSDKDIVILSKTLEDLGLLTGVTYRARWEQAVMSRRAEDMRASHIASRVRSKENADVLQAGAERAAQRLVEEAVRGLMIYVLVDRSGSMEGAIERAKEHVATFLPAFPEGKVRVAVFEQVAREVEIKHRSKLGVDNAFRGIVASGGTCHREGVRALAKYKPGPDEDAVFFFVGDEGERDHFATVFDEVGIRPAAFLLHRVQGTGRWAGNGQGSIVRDTAARLGIPCALVTEETFEDVYATPRVLRDLLKATPVVRAVTAAAPARKTLIEEILATEPLQKPAWAIR